VPHLKKLAGGLHGVSVLTGDFLGAGKTDERSGAAGGANESRSKL
jgi:hypothetical protein